MKDPLVIDIQSTVYKNVLIYIVQVTYQEYIGCYFTTNRGHNFTASNGFRLSSQSCPALYRKNNTTCGARISDESISDESISGMWDHTEDMMCVRGTDYARHNQRMYIDSIVYIEKLKSAVTEYNEFMRGD